MTNEKENENEKDPSQDQVSEDAQKNKGLGIVAYIIFFIPLLVAKESKFATYHANQGLLLLLTAIIINTAGTLIPIIGWLLILPFGNLFVFILWLIGILNAAKGEKAPLPVIGKYAIIK
ncbi:DUF4870 domain-containing protein [Alkalibacillus haloalkaliphilus]|uniref:DUF4870 domain-containing protein n=1 Tax=Alkalibacillus haloalkaliphilus TaxID=94136 RepID=UPI0029357F9B|nr:hypothetical protein [Alkalibacillus haloalkaliphilus]MDV2581501.1 hypothetical protein [Alkalibacillus haloalkaliphilus]